MSASFIVPVFLSLLTGAVIGSGLILYSVHDGTRNVSFVVKNASVSHLNTRIYYAPALPEQTSNAQSFPAVEEKGVVRFALENQMNVLRIDPMNEPGVVEFCDLKIQNSLGLTILEWSESSLEKWGHFHDMKPVEWISPKCLLVTSIGIDPFFLTVLPSNLNTVGLVKTEKVAAFFALFFAIALWPLFSTLTSASRANSPRDPSVVKSFSDLAPQPILIVIGLLGIFSSVGFWFFLKNMVNSTKVAPTSPIRTAPWEVFEMSLVDYQNVPLSKSPGGYLVYLHPSVGYRAVPGLENSTFHLDQNGFRKTIKSKGDVKIRGLLSGGSTAFGMGARGDQNTIPSRLVQDHEGLEFSNWGHIGYTLGQEISLATSEMRPNQFDVVMSLTSFNDYIVNEYAVSQRLPYSYDAIIAPFATSLNIIFKSSFEERKEPIFTTRLTKGLDLEGIADAVAQKAVRFSTDAGRNGAKFIMILQPEFGSKTKLTESEKNAVINIGEKRARDFSREYIKYTDRLTQKLKHSNIPVLNLNRGSSFQNSPDNLFLDQCHFTDLGNQLAAQEISKFMGWSK